MQRIMLALAAACVLAAGATRLSAQNFDGIMQFVSYEDHAGSPDTMTQFTKGSKIRFEGMGQEGGAMIFTGTSSFVIMPDQKMYMELPADFGAGAAAKAAKRHGVAVKTGKSETIAGISCDVWHYKGTDDDGKPQEGDVCLAKGAGLQLSRLTHGLSGQFFTEGGPQFAEALKTGGLMKATDNGKLSFLAVKAQATSVPDAMFAVPAGYTKMSMPSMGRPPHE